MHLYVSISYSHLNRKRLIISWRVANSKSFSITQLGHRELPAQLVGQSSDLFIYPLVTYT